MDLGSWGSSLVAQLVKNPQHCRRPPFDSWVGKIPWRRDRIPTPVFLGFPGGSDSKESICDAGDLGSIPGWGRSPGGGHGNPLQYSCLENPHGQRSLAGYNPWGHKESDTTEQQSTAQWLMMQVILSYNWLLVVCISSLRNCLFKFFAHF